MKKFVLGFLVVLILGAGIAAGLLLVNQQQIFKQKASSPTGTATVSLSPAQGSFQRNTPNTISVNFNPNNLLISGIALRLTFSNLSVSASQIVINPALLATGDWSCPVKTITSVGSTAEINILCSDISTTGYTASTDTLLATFNLTASQVPVENPLIVSFDPQVTKITQKSDGSDIALTPSSTGSYTITDIIAGSPSPSATVIVATQSPTPTASALALATATATALATTTATPYVIPTTTPIVTPTASSSATMPPIPVTGFDTPTIVGGAAGIIMLLAAGIFLIF